MAQNVTSEVRNPTTATGADIQASILTQGSGRRFEFNINCTNLSGEAVEQCSDLVREATETARDNERTLWFFLAGKAILKTIIRFVLTKVFGVRDDQRLQDIEQKCLHVILVCLTDERFLEILEMYETGILKDRLEEEFQQAGIVVEGLTISIINMKEVNQWKAEAIERLLNKKKREDNGEDNDAEMKGQEKCMEEFQDELKANQDKIKPRLNAFVVQDEDLEINQKETKVNINEIKQNLDEVKRSQTAMKEDQAAMKVEIKQQLETLTNTMKHFKLEIFQSISRLSARLPATHEIIIAGGYFGHKVENPSSTVETFSWPDGKWTYLSSMNQARVESASCIYNNDVIVTGGYDGQSFLDTIEILKSNEKPLQWILFNGKLPANLSSHAVTVHQDKLIITGGNNANGKKTSNVIYEMLLTPPYTTKVLVTMPEEKENHAVELVNNKLFILGGTTSHNAKDSTNSVFVYDLTEKTCEPCATLPYAVCFMATVTWGNYIIVLGGRNKKSEVLNEVIKFDTVTGKSEQLPSMIHKRRGCSAVIIDETIVVMGGWNEDHGTLNSVECLRIGSDGWKKMPSMRKCRVFATSVVKPQN